MINDPLSLVSIYIVKIDKTFDINSCIGFFDSSIKAKILSFHRKEDMVRALTSQILQQYVIAKIYNMKPHDLIFKYNEYKKPCLFLPDNKQIKYNISHSGDYVVLAVFNGEDYEIGVDIEKICQNEDYNTISKIAFSELEQKQIIDSNTFYQLWTKKEALLKAIGCGFMTDFYQTTTLNLLDVEYRDSYIIQNFQFKGYYISVCLYRE